jgi:putative Mg2+ transporter-C (MgtC) family protein
MISWQTMLLRLALAAVLGAVIGLERERKDWSAGMRTHMMVCVGSALTIIVSSFGFADVLRTPNVVLDPSRIAAQVISGIGFLGAGTILFLRPGFIRGLTTASGLWTVAAIGLAVGSGMYFAAIITTVIAIVILLILQPFEKRFARRFKQKYVRISVDLTADPSSVVSHLMAEIQMDVSSFSFDKSENGYMIEIKFDEFDVNKMMPALLEIEKHSGVKEVFWSK